jgi:hypothetical protein
MTVDEFVNRISKPMYVYRMAKPYGQLRKPSYSGYPTEIMRKSAKTRMDNAAKEIDDLIMQYAGIK